jgi:uncharacterized OsmC-like protein
MTEGSGPAAERAGVTVVGGAGWSVDIAARSHVWKADEPASAGGSDSGPTPYELILAALGACKAVTMRLYADRKGWPLEESRIRLAHDRIHAEDCMTCETKEGRIDRIEVEIELHGALSADQRERLHEIAGRCPVHRTLTGEIEIQSRLA